MWRRRGWTSGRFRWLHVILAVARGARGGCLVGEKERGWEGFTDLHPNDMPTKKSIPMFSVTATKPSRRAQAARPPERQVRDDRRVASKHAEDLPRQVARVPPTTCARSDRRGKGGEVL